MDNKNLPAIPKEIKVYIPTSALSKLSIDEIAAIEAGAGKVIKDYGTADLANRVNQIVWDAFVIRGHNVKDEKYYDAAAQFATELQKSFSVFTIEHISEAVRMGAIGKLESEDDENKIVHISAHGLCRWVWMWNDKVKREAIAKRNKALEEEERTITEEKKDEYTEKFIQDIEAAYMKFLEVGDITEVEDYYAAAMYGYVEKQYGPLKLEIKTTLFSEATEDMKDYQLTEEDLRLKYFFKSEWAEKFNSMTKQLARKKALAYCFELFKENEQTTVF